MDAYSSYIMTISNARTSELRREAADYALSAGARRERRARWIAALRRPWRRAGEGTGAAPAGPTSGDELDALVAVAARRREAA
jgi:hypothetical protein